MNTDKYILQEVTTSAQEREWLDLPKKIYKGNRNWVCPLDQDITESSIRHETNFRRR